MLPAAAYQPVRYNQLPGVLPPQYAVEDYRRFRTELNAIRETLLHHPGHDTLTKAIDSPVGCEVFACWCGVHTHRNQLTTANHRVNGTCLESEKLLRLRTLGC